MQVLGVGIKAFKTEVVIKYLSVLLKQVEL